MQASTRELQGTIYERCRGALGTAPRVEVRAVVDAHREAIDELAAHPAR